MSFDIEIATDTGKKTVAVNERFIKVSKFIQIFNEIEARLSIEEKNCIL
jgi:hypothetical protein